MQIQSKYREYYLTERIRQYEYGDVYLGQVSEEAGTEFVVRIFNVQLISLRERQRFLQEINALASLRHPALLPLLDAGIDKGGNPYLIRAYARGGSLITQLALQDELIFPLPMVMAILTRIAAAVTYLHQEQVCHGGIKPENILFDSSGQAVLADPHISSLNPEIPSTVYEPILTEKGLVRWEQPLFVRDDRAGEMQADIYALSSMAYELLTGYQPFSSVNDRTAPLVPPSQRVPSLPKQVDAVFLRALSPHPEERFGSAAFFVEALRRAFDMPGIGASAQTKTEQARDFDAQPEGVISQSQTGRQLVPLQSQSVLPLQTSNRSLALGQSSPSRHNIFKEFVLSIVRQLDRLRPPRGPGSGTGRSGKGPFPFKLPLIILTALLILFSILIPALLFHHQAPPVASRHERSQSPVNRHSTSLATAQPPFTAIPTKHTVPDPTSAPKPTPTLAPLPMPVIVNASFEVPALGGGYEYTPDNTGWAFSEDCGIASNDSTLLRGSPHAPWGTQVAFIQAYGTMSQNVSFAQGTYRISFLAAQRNASTQSLWVLIDNTVVGSFTPVGGNYLYYTTPGFIVSPGIHTLQFKGLRGGAHNTLFIDSVSLIR